MISRHRRLLWATTAIFAALTVGVIGLAATDTATESSFNVGVSDLDPAGLKTFADFPIYSVGAEFETLELKAIIRQNETYRVRPDAPESSITMNRLMQIYGDCKASSDSGCAPPLEIHTWPACVRNRTIYDGPGTAFPPKDTTIAGVPAAELPESLEIYTGSITIVIHADLPLARRAAAALVPANALAQNEFATDGQLPAPVVGAMSGDLRC